jgi:predicted dehydrogenase
VPSLLVKLAVPLRQCRESASAFVRNARRFSRADLHYFAGLHALLRAFYRAVLDGRPSPITSDRVLRVAALMDGIIRALPRRRSIAAADAEPARIQ